MVWIMFAMSGIRRPREEFPVQAGEFVPAQRRALTSTHGTGSSPAGRGLPTQSTAPHFG